MRFECVGVDADADERGTVSLKVLLVLLEYLGQSLAEHLRQTIDVLAVFAIDAGVDREMTAEVADLLEPAVQADCRLPRAGASRASPEGLRRAPSAGT